MAQAVRGFPLLPVYSGGFPAICFICHFNAPVRRFNSGRCAYIAAALRALCALFMALWRGVAPSAVRCRFTVCCQLAAALASLWPYRWLPPDRWRGLCGCRFGSLHAGRPGAAMACLAAKVAAKVATRVAGKVAKVAGIVAVKVASVCAKVAAKAARFTQKS